MDWLDDYDFSDYETNSIQLSSHEEEQVSQRELDEINSKRESQRILLWIEIVSIRVAAYLSKRKENGRDIGSISAKPVQEVPMTERTMQGVGCLMLGCATAGLAVLLWLFMILLFSL